MKTRLVTIALIIYTSFSCSDNNTQSEKGKQALKVVATTGMLYDAVVNIGKEQVSAIALMGPGVDPHLYKATQGDLTRLKSADLIIYNGLTLEGKMADILEKLGREKHVVAVGDAIADSLLLPSLAYSNAFDPHIWFDVSLWQLAVGEITQALVAADSLNAKHYQENAQKYLLQLEALHQEVKETIATIPPDQRVLITAHDAFGYFGRAYAIEVKGLQGISTVADFGLRDVANLIDLIIERDIHAIFVETSVSDRAIQAVLSGCNKKGHPVTIGGNLYSDAMGELGTPEGTYVGMVRANVKTITDALK